MSKLKRRALCAVLCAALLLSGAAGLLHWADGQYARRLAGEIWARYADGVLQGEDFQPLTGAESVLLLERAASPITLLSTAARGPESVLIPYLPDYGSDLDLRREEALWRLSYRTLDKLEVQADYSAAGPESMTVYLPGPDLEVRMAWNRLHPQVGMQSQGFTPHARRGVTLSGLWTALTAELERKFSVSGAG